MTIGINGYEAVVPRFGYDSMTGLPRRVGSGEYCFELLLNLNKIDKKNNYIIYLPQSRTADLPKESSNWRYKIVGPRKLWTLFSLSLEFLFKRSKADIFFTPTHYLPVFSPQNSVISILDTSYIGFPKSFRKSDLWQLKNWTAYSVKKAKKIFTISQNSKDDIIKEYRVSADSVKVTYPGIKEGLMIKDKGLSMDEIKKKYGVGGKYVLFVGTLQPRKNIVRLIEAFAKVVARGPAPTFPPASAPLTSSKMRAVGSPSSRVTPHLSLVIVGKKGWMYEEILKAPKVYNVEERVRFLDFVSDEDLISFYQNALCFILPSLYEGFGLPVLEAMKYGCPVITSNVSSLPEAGGDAALYVNPLNTDDIKEKMELMINDKGLRMKFVKKGYEQVKKFSWEKTARKTLNALEGLMIPTSSAFGGLRGARKDK